MAPTVAGTNRRTVTRCTLRSRSGHTATPKPSIRNAQPSHTKLTSGLTFSCRVTDFDFSIVTREHQVQVVGDGHALGDLGRRFAPPAFLYAHFGPAARVADLDVIRSAERKPWCRR